VTAASGAPAADRIDVLVVGGIGVDETVYLQRPLQPGSYTPVAAPIRRTAAGSATNVAVALSGAGLHTAISGAVGTDTDGDWLRRTLADADVRCHIAGVPGPSPRSLILVEPSGERTIIGLNNDLLEHAGTQMPAGAYSMLVVSSWRPQFHDLLQSSRTGGVCTVVGLRALTDPRVRADIAVGSRTELGGADPADALDRFGTVVVTAAQHGADVFTGADHTHVAAVEAKPVDATGAGDAFLAGLVAGLAHGDGLGGALRLATTWGAAAVATPGATAPPYHLVNRMCKGAPWPST
jgi:sugar/nucleoside kinase (ribokinase family)